jgi:hypothetical protein
MLLCTEAHGGDVGGPVGVPPKERAPLSHPRPEDQSLRPASFYHIHPGVNDYLSIAPYKA